MRREKGVLYDKPKGPKTVALFFLGLIAVLGTAFFVVSLAIGSGVRSVSAAALREHPGDRIAALLAYADSPAVSLHQRNRAVWALGQIGDARAMPFLEKRYHGGPCDHDRALCRYELKKAIKACRGGMNLSAWLWRPRFLRS